MISLVVGRDGRRKYVTNAERAAMLAHAYKVDLRTFTLLWLLSATGCRISEALNLTFDHIDVGSQSVVIESLKKRRKGVFRAVPVPVSLIEKLKIVHAETMSNTSQRLWPWSRTTGYRKISQIMRMAGINGSQASPKGLRHGFGVSAVQSGVPLNLVQRWLGHSDMKTTAIYTSAIGAEELSIALRMWKASAVLVKPAAPVQNL
ncbi:tyrosine-type recombinase/integrase [Sphingobium sp. B12D2B]|uniref:tyrosine-type recombinase/integrase n=1 Tax=Sphingobium sp. B12D2B TaxID=2940577 RepID=UPI00222400DC|nr:site-specific integrase [Sphingobium sp. B12D2B]MCW2351812.1 integrase [Sphingobium sp. B12D2B]